MPKSVTIIMYHYVRDLPASRYPAIKGLDAGLFARQLDFLSAYGSFVSCADVKNAMAGGSLPENPILLTFDDGYIDHYTTVFPLLNERRIPAFFSMPGKILAESKVLDVNKIHFILASTPMEALLPMVYERLDHYRGAEWEIPENAALYEKLAVASRFDPAEVIFVKRLLQVELPEGLRNLIVDDLFARGAGMPEAAFAKELYMSREQVKLMARSGMEWGIHGYDHYWMNRLTPEALASDITRALDVFDGVVDKKDWWCCYPYGSWSEDVICYVQTQGATGGFGTEVRAAVIAEADRFKLPRFDTNDFPPKSENYKKYEPETEHVG